MNRSTGALEQFGFLFNQDGGYLRIPIWGHIPLGREVRRIIEHHDFVRLAKIRQLGLVHYVFPGATHTRFEHSIGTYYLAVLMLQRLVMNPINWNSPSDPKISPEDACIFLAAALLHDIGHYPFAHIVDRLITKDDIAFSSHEDRARAYILDDRTPGSLYAILKDEWGISDPSRVADVIANPFHSGLPGKMLSGILDPDKMDYLMRDAWACGVPYGNIDTDRLIESLVLDIDGSYNRLGISQKGVAPLESLVFAKYMMFRHIYWHHTVRIAFAMLTRFVQDGLENGVVASEDFYNLSDDALIEELTRKSENVLSGSLISSMRDRNLYKRGLTFYPEHDTCDGEFSISGEGLENVKELYRQPILRREKEVAICAMLNRIEGFSLEGFEVLIDIPRINSVFDVKDFAELRVLVTPQSGGKDVFVPFNSHGFTQLTVQFAQEFERFSRPVQVICRADLKDALIRHASKVKELVCGNA